MTTRRYDRIQAHAADLLTQAGGAKKLNSLGLLAYRAALVSLAWQLVEAEGVTYKTARQHLDRAMNPNFTPPKWGGDRSKNPA